MIVILIIVMRPLLLLTFLFALPPAFAHNHTHLQFEEVDSQAIHAFMHDAHEAFESEDPSEAGIKNFLINWGNAFNMKQVGINAYRWYQLQRDNSPLKDHALNIVSMLLASHSLEVASGPIGVALSHYTEMPNWVGVTAGAVGTVISVPGLDPLCIGLLAIYPQRQVRNSVQWMRLFTVRMMGGALNTLGFGTLMNKLIVDESGMHRLLRRLDEEGRARLSIDNEQLKFSLESVTLHLKQTLEGDVELHSMVFNHEHLGQTQSRKELARALKGFGWNIRNAVLQSYDLLSEERTEQLARLVHVNAVKPKEENEIEVRFKPSAVSLRRHKLLRCSDAAKWLAQTD